MNKPLDIRSFKGLTQDSRAVKTGYLFAALPGSKADGRQYIVDAIRNGARAILAAPGTALPDDARGVDLIIDENPRHRLALLAAEFYGRQPACAVAVTGTNGKTSTVHFTKQIWRTRGLKAASIGTLGVRGPGLIRSGSMTTPDPVSLQAELADMAAAGIDHLAMEASSHGLDQCRLDGVKLRAAGFTNLTRDHLDYHKDMEHYFASKLRLFTDVMPKGGVAVLNADIPEYGQLCAAAEAHGHRVISYGFKARDLKIIAALPTPHGQDLTLEIYGQKLQTHINLVGQFQAMNALCALGLAIAEAPDDISLRAASLAAMADIHGAPGRLQLVPGHKAGAAVYIDYAHTPDALETILKALRPHTDGRLVCLFGCGGDRDAGKRPIMGEIASRLADHVIVTDDNPRSEKPDSIRKAIVSAAKGAVEIPGRREAIKYAVTDLKAGDVLVIAGKGHEQGQIFDGHTEPFDDFEEAEKAIRESVAS